MQNFSSLASFYQKLTKGGWGGGLIFSPPHSLNVHEKAHSEIQNRVKMAYFMNDYLEINIYIPL